MEWLYVVNKMGSGVEFDSALQNDLPVQLMSSIMQLIWFIENLQNSALRSTDSFLSLVKLSDSIKELISVSNFNEY